MAKKQVENKEQDALTKEQASISEQVVAQELLSADKSEQEASLDTKEASQNTEQSEQESQDEHTQTQQVKTNEKETQDEEAFEANNLSQDETPSQDENSSQQLPVSLFDLSNSASANAPKTHFVNIVFFEYRGEQSFLHTDELGRKYRFEKGDIVAITKGFASDYLAYKKALFTPINPALKV
ncbi:hypothetical protein DMB95_00095 [Campylobacter sp. MIT 12-8780]|uniref:hypothetical protein n=1 Tax=Campylobacter sp. MIT 12-8780 TaxID=2202200 RepID=UPI00115EF1A5|nr:hypothetical protein [Campylobacter sp. MIT 12-8780]TQR42936.1 hypothetical protein DMB95_00095 [Campylobacter sp. MIT 12-8780]